MSTGVSTRSLPILLVAVVATFTAQQMLAPVLAPLSRAAGLDDIALGAVMTTAAALFTATSLVWGRVVDRVGRRRVLLIGLTAALAGVVGFAVVSQAALAGHLSPTATMLLMMATRALLFGAGIGAVPVAAMSLVAATTEPGPARTRGLGQLGAVQGAANALGPALGGLLGFAGLLGPIWAAPAVVAIALVVVLVGVPADPPLVRTTTAAPASDTGAAPTPPRPIRPWDPRLWPILLTALLALAVLGLVLIVIGFLVQDRLGLTPEEAVGASGAASFATGVVLVIVQGLAVPRLGWTPVRLMRAGLPVTVAALVALAFAPTLVTITGSLMLLAVGLGLATPGITAAPTMLVGPSEQGSMAGLVNATIGLTFMIGPLAGTSLYQLDDALPALVAAGAAAGATAMAYLHPALARLGEPDPARAPSTAP